MCLFRHIDCETITTSCLEMLQKLGVACQAELVFVNHSMAASHETVAAMFRGTLVGRGKAAEKGI
jgi:hypothetical protein